MQGATEGCYTVPMNIANDSLLEIFENCAIPPLHRPSAIASDDQPALYDIYKTNYSYQLFYLDMHEFNQHQNVDLNRPSHSFNNNSKPKTVSTTQSNTTTNNKTITLATQLQLATKTTTTAEVTHQQRKQQYQQPKTFQDRHQEQNNHQQLVQLPECIQQRQIHKKLDQFY